MNVLVTGSNGQLGTELRRLAIDSPHHFIFTDINNFPGTETVYLDICDRAAIDIIIASERVDLIVNCAAYTDVEKAESEIDMAMLLNHQAVENLALAAAARDAAIIHISTDYVFSGEGNQPIREDAAPAPKGVYGSTKGEGPLQIRLPQHHCAHILAVFPLWQKLREDHAPHYAQPRASERGL